MASKNDKIKIGFAIAALVVAGVVLAMYFGVIGGDSTPPPSTEYQQLMEEADAFEQTEEFQRQQRQQQQDIEAGRIIEAGA
ncbi:MAG: hypothetical protein EA423_04145 [Phycisphaerales bacterium]|nr:MAG: hypothetical protein EA423_04145 [Phycisphaerales bacterium]